jgi:hypothetical protein
MHAWTWLSTEAYGNSPTTRTAFVITTADLRGLQYHRAA